ncbi:MAG: DNA-directed RNA polymerase subunit P [Candidatus Woesearchaeota archaeon]
MVDYKCFSCKKVVADTYIKKKVRCPYCGSRLIFKPRISVTKVKAR